MNKDLKNLVKALNEQGFDTKPTKSRHTTVRLNGAYVTTLPGTPSDWRSWRNAIAACRRAGFRWPP